LVIDPEAPDPPPDEVKQHESKGGIASDLATRTKQSPSKQQNEMPSSQPCLDVVVGCWLDAKNSFYEVIFDEDSTASCHVKTTRPGGAVRETKGLIRIGQARGKQVGRIIWGSAFVLEMPIEDPDQLQWKSIRGGRDFSWTRAVETEEPSHSSTSANLEPVAESEAPQPELQQPEPRDHSSPSGREKSTARVWRAIRDNSTPQEIVTPDEVAAATRRRVKSRNGEWRIIDKKLVQ
jgi:hypothetical protein